MRDEATLTYVNKQLRCYITIAMYVRTVGRVIDLQVTRSTLRLVCHRFPH